MLPTALAQALLDQIDRVQQSMTPGQIAQQIDPRTVQTPALDLIDQELMRLLDTPDGRLIISMPPQEGKSTRCSRDLPIKALRDNPELRIILGSYAQGLANRNGRAVRNAIINHPELGMRIAPDNGAASEWTLAGHDGGVLSVGRGAGVTGRPADCVRGDMHIDCEYGRITAADAFSRGIARILAYDHAAGRAVWRNVEAARRIDGRPTLEITTEAGRVLVCTPDHRIYSGRGYVPAGSLRRGDSLVAVVDAGRMPLRQGVPATDGRSTEGDHSGAGALLLAVVHVVSVLCRQPYALLRVWRANPAQPLRHLFARVRAQATGGHVARGVLPDLRSGVPTRLASNAVLRAGVRLCGPFSPDGWTGQLALQDRHELRKVVPVHAPTDPRTGRRGVRSLLVRAYDYVRTEWANRDAFGAGDPSSERTALGQPGREPDHALPDLSRSASQVGADTVSVVRDLDDGAHDVYDFQVEGARNFFANGVLVHNCLIIDDPLKDRLEADSRTIRDTCWDWWTDALSARLAPGAPVLAIQCMTGDTPVLMADGSEVPLRDIRPGDSVATYEGGRLSTSTVVNWANQGPDAVFSVRMRSGRTVRANARHPFLTINANGVEEWLRTESLRPGSRILTATGASGAESPALQMGATSQPSARACACPTTARLAGKLGIDPRLSMLSHAAGRASSTDMDSPTKRSTSSLSSSTGSVPSAGSRRPTRTPERTGTGSSASITTTTPARFEDSSATTATSPSATGSHPKCCAQPLTTWSVTPDEVVSVEPCGRDDVFDVQIAETENFIANGLVSHNTRWHQDDLAGRLQQHDADAGWRVLNIPAQCEDPATDPLGRELGEFMVSARGRSREQWEQRKATAGSRTWNALYQGRPAPAEGGLIKRDWWQRYTIPPERGTLLQSWDLAFKDAKTSDYVVGQVWMHDGANAYLLDQVRGRWGFTETVQQIEAMSARWPAAHLKLIEDKANGPAVIDSLRGRLAGIVPVNPQGGKEARAAAVSPFIEAGNVLLPERPFAAELIEECAAFPNATHDDQVDAMTQALARIFITSAGTGATRNVYRLG